MPVLDKNGKIVNWVESDTYDTDKYKNVSELDNQERPSKFDNLESVGVVEIG